MPRIKHAKAVNRRAGHNKPPEVDIITDVIFTPKPVIPSTPIIMEAQRIIAAIVAICLPAVMLAFSSLKIVRRQSKVRWPSRIKSITPTIVAKHAEY